MYYPHHFWVMLAHCLWVAAISNCPVVEASRMWKPLLTEGLSVAISISRQPSRICLKTPWTALSGWTIQKLGLSCYRSPESSRRWIARRGECQSTVPLPTVPRVTFSSPGGCLDSLGRGAAGRAGGAIPSEWVSRTRAYVVTANCS